MEYSRLGNTNLHISHIAFGCAPMGGYDYGPVNDDDSMKAVRKALDLGINFFDTADIYGFGHAETILGNALSGNRDKAFIATKFGLVWDDKGKIIRDCSPKRVVKALEDSLRRLKADVVDLYQMHWIDPETPIRDTMEILLRCQREGKIRYIGCSNMTEDIIKDIQRIGRVDTVQFSYNLLNRKAELRILPYCKELKISFVAHSPLARGFLTGKYQPGHKFFGTDTRNKSTYFSTEKMHEKKELISNIAKIGIKYDKTNTQVALRWILDNPLVSNIIVGVKDMLQIEESAGSVGWSLTPEDYSSLCVCTEDFVHEGLY